MSKLKEFLLATLVTCTIVFTAVATVNLVVSLPHVFFILMTSLTVAWFAVVLLIDGNGRDIE